MECAARKVTFAFDPNGHALSSQDADLLDEFLRRHRFSGLNKSRHVSGEAFRPIHVAAIGGDYQLIRILLAAGADVRKKTALGFSAVDLVRAHQPKHWQLIAKLLEHGGHRGLCADWSHCNCCNALCAEEF